MGIDKFASPPPEGIKSTCRLTAVPPLFWVTFPLPPIEKKPLTLEEKKARWKADATGKKAFCVEALTVSDKKKKVESEANYIMNYGGRSSLNTANDLEPLTAINIVMTTAKAEYGILLLFAH